MQINAESIKPQSLLTNIPLVSLLVANLLPIFGVLFFGWDAFAIVLLYWSENVILGFYNILKMAFLKVPHPAMHLGKLFMIPFFTFHYGMFTFVHGIFVFAFFNGKWDQFGNVENNPFEIHLPYSMYLAFAGLIISHGISFGYNYLYKGEYRQKSLQTLMGEPYGRIIVMHIAILAGGFLTMSMGSPIGILIVLVILKTVIDVKLHLREHRVKEIDS